ncbi:MAG: N-acetylmuramoyl-L-alanine amidase [Clostridia bacterium]|nr:N-acetylmuramoyl-L-alanine amidase [Clostridia bacterium]
MAKKLYISAAAHATDNATKCPGACSENTHCKAYMDLVEARMKAHGVAVRRGYATATGNGALTARVREANAWGADLYYVAHTNAGGGRYSVTMCWGDAPSLAKARVLHKHRKTVTPHKIVTRRDLYEIRATKMICLYDELFFHDNAEDCRRFHSGGMEQMAEETVAALCEMLGVAYRAPQTARKAGDTVRLVKQKLYLASTGTAGVTRTGTFYLYDGKSINGRYRVTNKTERVGKTPVALNVSGWVQLD